VDWVWVQALVVEKMQAWVVVGVVVDKGLEVVVEVVVVVEYFLRSLKAFACEIHCGWQYLLGKYWLYYGLSCAFLVKVF
jgi:hypothetical protein